MTGVTRIYLMRHGEVANGPEKRYNGHIDVDISTNGVLQMHRLAALLTGKPIDAVYASDLIRSVRGARLIAHAVGRLHTELVSLRERSLGQWEGMTASEIEESSPAEFCAWRSNLLHYRPPGGESLLDVVERVMPVVRNVIHEHRGREVALLLHGGVNRIILADALRMDIAHLFSIDQAFGALNIIDYYEDGIAVVKLLNG